MVQIPSLRYLVVFLGLEIQLIGLAGDNAVANLSQIIAEIPVICAGHGQRLAVLLGINRHQEIDVKQLTPRKGTVIVLIFKGSSFTVQKRHHPARGR